MAKPTILYIGDSLTTANLSLVVIWLVVTLVQCGLVAKIVSNPANASRRGIFGVLSGGTICSIVAYGSRIFQIVTENSTGGLAGSRVASISLYALNLFAKTGYVIVYISVFLATYNRVAFYLTPSSRAWNVKKIVDGILTGTWTLVYIIKIAWRVAADVARYIDLRITVADYTARRDTSRSLQAAVDSFFILVGFAAIVGIIMLNNVRKSRGMRDYVVRTLMFWMLPALSCRTAWNIITAILYDTPALTEQTTLQAESISLADWIVDDLLYVIIVGAMVRLGSQVAYWDAPTPTKQDIGPVHHLPQGEQTTVGEPEGMYEKEKV